jgi:hypothetical protein
LLNDIGIGDSMGTAKNKPTKRPKGLRLIPTIYPTGYKDWLGRIRHFNKVHNVLPTYLSSFNDLDGWLACYHLNCLDSHALDIVTGYAPMPKRKKLKNRYVEFEREVYRFMTFHKIGGYQFEKESEHGLNAMYAAKMTPLEAVDCVMGLRSLGGEYA